MKRYVYNEQMAAVPALSAEILQGSAVARLLWQGRGRRHGTTLVELSTGLQRPEKAVTAQLAALRRALLRCSSPWQLTSWTTADQDTGDPQEHYLLTHPACPRPAPRPTYQLRDGPELISLSELEDYET